MANDSLVNWYLDRTGPVSRNVIHLRLQSWCSDENDCELFDHEVFIEISK